MLVAAIVVAAEAVVEIVLETQIGPRRMTVKEKEMQKTVTKISQKKVTNFLPL